MAAGGDQRAQCKETLKGFLERGVTDNTLKLSPLKKAFNECGLKAYVSTLESSIWLKHADKAKKNCSIDKILDTVIPDLAEYEAKNKKKDKDTVLNDIMSKLSKKPEAKTQKVDAITAKLTDTSQYTGAHKERFGADGKGKGIDGREERSENTGYTKGYETKHKDTYDAAHKK